LERYKSPDGDQIPAELIQAGVEKLGSEINKLINSVWIKEELISGSSLLLYQFTTRAMKLTVVIVGYHCFQLHAKFHQVTVKSIYIYMKLLGVISEGCDVTDLLQIRFSAFIRYWRQNGSTVRQYIIYS
jgi:hypothetical protein